MTSKKAFTLIELLMVIVLIGIISGLIMVTLGGATNGAKDGKRKADIGTLRKAIHAYSVLNGNTYPVATCSVNSSCTALYNALVPTYLPSLPTDPTSATTYYSYTSNGSDFTVSSTLSNSTTYSYTASTGFSGGSGVVEAWLTNYTKRKPIVISSSAAQTDYQVLVTVAYDSDMQADFDDLRFTTSDKTTLIDYWIESKTDSSIARVWVEVPTIANGNTTIYMYYGNSSTTSLSNGLNTFPLFDDFSGTMAKWTGGNGTVTVSGGKMNMSGGSYNDANAYFRSNQTFIVDVNNSYAAEFMNWTATSVSAGYNWNCGFFSAINGTRSWLVPTSGYIGVNHHTSAGDSTASYVNQASTSIASNSAASLTQARDVTVVYGHSLYKSYTADGTLFHSSTASGITPGTVTAGFYVGCVNYDGGAYAGVSSFDGVFVRKALATDPTVTPGTEESN